MVLLLEHLVHETEEFFAANLSDLAFMCLSLHLLGALLRGWYGLGGFRSYNIKYHSRNS